MTLAEFLELFGPPLLATLFVSISAPIVGVFLRARGMTFHGIVLPELATLGIAVGYAAHPVIEEFHGHSEGESIHEFGRAGMMIWATVFVALGSILLRGGSTDRADAGANVARGAALFAIAGALTILAKQVSPHGGLHVDAILSGETLAVMGPDVVIVASVALLTVLMTLQRWQRLALTGHDPEFATVAGVSPAGEAMALGTITCLVVMTGTLSIGALPLFGLLVLPAWALHGHVPSMASALVLAPLLGVIGAGVGVWGGFRLDIPLGAAVVAGVALLALPVAIRGSRR